MTPLHVQNYLRTSGTLEALARDYAVRHTRHGAYPNLVLLKYDQINSPMDNPLVQECRGIVLDQSDDWRVAARAFDKFFNYGKPNAAPIDWATAHVQEKVDGSLIVFYHYGGQWQTATTGTPDASGPVHNGTVRFADLVWETAQNQHLKLRSPEHTYLFELTGPLNRVVVAHGEARLTLLGIRHTQRGAWVPQDELGAYYAGDVAVVREFAFDSFEAILESFAHLDPLAQEGYVVVDGAGNRVKLKHPRYVALHLLKSQANPRAYVEVLRAGETPELLAYFPELQPDFAPIRDAYNALADALDGDYARIKESADQKAFAQEAAQSRCSAALFAIRAGHCQNAREFLGTRAHLSLVLRLLEIKEELDKARGE